MKIAVIDHVGNHGGGSRVIGGLLPAMKQLDPGLEMVYFCNLQSAKREGFTQSLKDVGIQVEGLYSALPVINSEALRNELESKVVEFDLAFFPWPFFLECPNLQMPMVSIFHDLNFKYFFGTRIFNDAQLSLLETYTPEWLRRSTPVVSSNFMKEELGSFYPETNGKTKVIRLPPLTKELLNDRNEAWEIVQGLGVQGPYLLYPTHLTVHKNIGPMIAAISHLEDMGVNVSLVLTGSESKLATGRATKIGSVMGKEKPNVIGVGYVTEVEMDALCMCASALVSSSLYEAGCGPGYDGWLRGVPVAVSDIPQFREHSDVQGVHAEYFDPRNPLDIAAKIKRIFDNPGMWAELTMESQLRIRHYTWESTASHYLNLFKSILTNG